jgi:hypothetical protein
LPLGGIGLYAKSLLLHAKIEGQLLKSMSSEIVNKSGFPLQIALAHQFTDAASRWKVLYEEHRWTIDEEEGFLDLAIEHKNKQFLINIECKRPGGGEWFFLLTPEEPKQTRAASVLFSGPFGWQFVPIDPPSFETCFCVVNGVDPKSRPMLERLAAALVRSTYALSNQEKKTLDLNNYAYPALRIYINAIVTTAPLMVCKVDPGRIDLSRGEINDSTKFEEVPYLRFRKQVGAPRVNIQPLSSDPEKLKEHSREGESTIFVINSCHFREFCEAIEVPDFFLGKLHYDAIEGRNLWGRGSLLMKQYGLLP